MFLLILLNILFIANVSAEAKISYYHQAVYLNKYENLIQQGTLKVTNYDESFDTYAGIYFDIDQKSDELTTYTDKQVSPLVGIQTKSKYRSRIYLEARDINRTGDFPDNRDLQTNEYRLGLLGYDKSLYTHFVFTEWYYNTFYSELYNKKIILQAWHKHGYNIKSFYLFNEILIDSFDISKQEQITVDARPGVKLEYVKKLYSLQFLTQYLIPLDHSGRDKEVRSSLIFYAEF